ncbi:uncharacterized protein PgNI_12101 [Pyricularia grisea]|uniref:Protein kinase domain-containing protein n=1 Tax=Pyricularia grisea TaxID=148305 RepID=A0A6P8AQR2_PYRGI|nr:uncharacterized protein PgNI_12101 [Pyricularia grisea]TLD04389.1 hypothetical protein PgNI_12101 [Pyricularia grisea]
MDVSTPSYILGDLRIGEIVQLFRSKSYERYSITRVKTLSDRRPASVWQAAISTFREPIVAKVLTYTDDIRATVRIWLQEIRIHSKIGSDKYQTIVQLLGVNARIYTFYMEAIQVSSLGDKNFRDYHGHFSSTNNNAERVLNDMVSALSWVHGLGVVHNDIKPANILFS